MRNLYYLSYDLETSSPRPRDPSTQILQIAAEIIDPKTFKIVDSFDTLVKPDDFSTVEEGALKVNKLKIEDLEKAKSADTIIPIFFNWIKKYNTRKDCGSWGAPVSAGWNIGGFDNVILERYAKRFGEVDKNGRQKIFNPIFSIDAMQIMFWLTLFNPDIKNVKQTTILEYCGVSKSELESQSHNAKYDVAQCSKIIIKLLKLSKYLSEKAPTGKMRLQLKGCLAGE